MQLTRQKIYNKHFFAVGAQLILATPTPAFNAEDCKKILSYGSLLSQEVDSVSHHFKVYLPANVLAKLSGKLDDEKSVLLCDESELLLLDSREIGRTDVISTADESKLIVSTQVNDYQSLNHLKQLGRNFFCGNFLESIAPHPNHNNTLNITNFKALLSQLNQPDNLNFLKSFFAKNAILSHKLIKMVNAPLFKEASHVHSITEIFQIFGEHALKKWALMLHLFELTDKPLALIQLSLQRALMCQMLAELNGFMRTEAFYIAGLLSTLHAFLDHPLNELLEDSDLNPELREAVIAGTGTIGKILSEVSLYQQGSLPSSSIDLHQCYLQCSKQTIKTLQAIDLASHRKKASRTTTKD